MHAVKLKQDFDMITLTEPSVIPVCPGIKKSFYYLTQMHHCPNLIYVDS